MGIEFINEVEKDYSEYCFQKLKALVPSYQKTEDEKCIWDYHRYKFRKITDTPRQVFVASSLNRRSKFENVVSQILNKIEKGEPLLEYQSRLLKNADFDDGMLMDWGVQHLHLGDSIESDGFVKRTKELLFIKFTPDAAYLLGIFEHNDWSTLKVLEIIHENWPKVIEQHKVRNIVDISHCPDEETIKKFREIGLNYAVKLSDGTVYMGPGGGITAAGTPAEVTHNVLHLRRTFLHAYNHIVEEFDAICEQIGIDCTLDKVSIGLNLSDGKLVYILKELDQGIVLA
ncbi:hypothetical protein Q4Q57_21985 [Shewanella sp. SP2S2-6]|uniref:hypothetical protein n=1 Tax=Shewanella sp. SP2S2-6 TaxID=3063540 RepID=UPI00288D5DE8|nr:hypothetical protein [Shewanella sp. SP2S2-6]MDT3297776.1 hypothetical protein [Shewanella sp. SP2S2-6]